MRGLLILVFSGCVYALILIILYKTKNKHTRFMVPAFIATAICIVLFICPVENALISFDSPHSVYQYIHFNQANLKMVIEGNESALIIGGDEHANEYLIIPKEENRWGVGVGKDTRKISQKITGDIVITIYRYQDSGDYYVVVHNMAGGEMSLTDDINTQFFALKKYSDTLEKEFVTYYAYVKNVNEQTWVSIDGKKIILLN